MSVPATLLVVHRDPSVHGLVHEALDAEHWSVDDAAEFSEAIACLELKPYDLVLAGVPPAGEDGIRFVIRVRALRPGTKIVLATAVLDPVQAIQSLSAGVTCCVKEPLSPPALRESLATVLSWHVDNDDIEISSAKPNWIALRLRSKFEVAERLIHFFRLLMSDLNSTDRDAIATGLRELLINAIEYGCGLDPDCRVNLTYVRAERCVICYIHDPGEGFSLDNLPHAAISNPESPTGHLELREQMGSRPGGFGILMAQKFADELLYSAKGNEVLLIRYLQPHS